MRPAFCFCRYKVDSSKLSVGGVKVCRKSKGKGRVHPRTGHEGP